MFCTFSLENLLRATAACNFSTSELQKVLPGPQSFNVFTWFPDPHFLNIFTCTCASRYSGVQFLRIRTSKCALKLRCFVHFHLKICFALQLQRRAIFAHQNFKKCSEAEVQFLRIRTSKSALPDRQFSNILTSKCAFRHSGVQFFDFSSDHSPPHPPLEQAYFSTDPTHESLKKHGIARLL